MFGAIKKRWKEARATELRKEVEDSIFRLNSAGQEVNFLACLTLADIYSALIAEYESLNNVSNDGKRVLAKMYLKKAKEKFTFNLGQAYGLFLLSSYIEAQILPGDDAKFVESITKEILKTALETKQNAESL